MGQPMPNLAVKRLAKTFAHNLRELRRNAGLTQERLAERAGLTDVSISRLEMGECVPTSDTLLRLALALRVPLDLFFGWRGTHLRWLAPPQAACPSCDARATWEERGAILACAGCGGRFVLVAWGGASFFSGRDMPRARRRIA